MKVGSKEFHELRAQFEKDVMKMPGYVGCDLTRETPGPGTSVTAFYCNGGVNTLFHGYMAGYQNAKCLARMGALEINE